jgi:arsenite methyltransferase
VTTPTLLPYEDTELRRVTGGVLRPGGVALTDHAVALARLRPGAVALDLGCGAGATVERLTDRYGLTAVGVDPSTTLIAAARARRPDLPLVRGRGERLPLPDGAFDAVFTECVLSLAADPAAVLAETARVLRPGGVLVLSDLYVRTAAAAALLRRLPACSCLHGAFTEGQLLGLLRDSGFGWVCWEDHSPALTELAVRLVLNTGSADRLWCPVPPSPPPTGGPVPGPASPVPAGPGSRPAGPGTGPFVALATAPPELSRAAIRAARPGYFLLLAEPTGG